MYQLFVNSQRRRKMFRHLYSGCCSLKAAIQCTAQLDCMYHCGLFSLKEQNKRRGKTVPPILRQSAMWGPQSALGERGRILILQQKVIVIVESRKNFLPQLFCSEKKTLWKFNLEPFKMKNINGMCAYVYIYNIFVLRHCEVLKHCYHIYLVPQMLKILHKGISGKLYFLFTLVEFFREEDMEMEK